MDLLITLHIIAAVAALVIGMIVLLSPKGTPKHKFLGRLWVTAMTFVAVGSFGIRSLEHDGGFSWIHFLSIFTLGAMLFAIINIRQGRIRAHYSAMIGSFIGAILAGIFTLDPDRIIGSFFFGG